MISRPSVCRRRLIDGIRWRVRASTPWRVFAALVRAVADGLWALPPLAARWC
ncbi:hypothetical protein [Streptomyces sp. ISL-100]|uniref:hypothetical protein n=1 Tax=Streptomyces sp. ISL-100 TaxID=2819173 RepID=UPI0035ABB83A